MMRGLRWIVPAIALGAFSLAAFDAPGGGPRDGLAQSQTTLSEGIGGDGPSPEICTRCYEQLEKDNRECETLRGQDWQICREAAATAYRRCSEGC